jgi:hypothetical protein
MQLSRAQRQTHSASRKSDWLSRRRFEGRSGSSLAAPTCCSEDSGDEREGECL